MAAGRHELITTLHEFLTSLVPIRASGVLIIDEAQHLSPQVLEEIRVLSNLETNQSKLLQIVLVGQLNLLDLLGQPEQRQLDQRVSLRAVLTPLGRIAKPDDIAIPSRPTNTRGGWAIQVGAFEDESEAKGKLSAAKGKVTGTIDLGGAPESGVADGAGLVFVNLEDKAELLKIDARKLKVLERWSLAPGKTPTGLEYDAWMLNGMQVGTLGAVMQAGQRFEDPSQIDFLGLWEDVRKGAYNADAMLVEPKTQKAEFYPRLDVEDPGSGKSTLVTSKDKSGATLAEMIIGKRRYDRLGTGTDGISGLIDGNPRQILIQLVGVIATLLWSGVATFALLKLIGLFVPLRVSKEHEFEGLDLSQHGEALQ